MCHHRRAGRRTVRLHYLRGLGPVGGCGVERDADECAGRVHGAGAGDDRAAAEGANRPLLPGALGARRPRAQRHFQPVLNA